MKPELTSSLSFVTEAAALAGYRLLGRGDKNAVDAAAVKAMRLTLNQLPIEGEIAIGEGEIDLAPMLYTGERLGQGGDPVDIAVDPIEGTRMVAMGQANAIATLALGERGAFLRAPDMYMEKLVVGPAAKGLIDLHLPLLDNLRRVAASLNKPLSELNLMMLDKPRHHDCMKMLTNAGIRLFAIPDGDVAAAILACMPDSPIDVLYGIGGSPEGVLAAAAVRALGGDMQGRLLLRHQVKGDTGQNRAFGEQERGRCHNQGIDIKQVLTLSDMVKSDNIVFTATGVTRGDLLDGITRQGDLAITDSLIITHQGQPIRRIRTTHDLSQQSSALQELIR